MPSQAAGGPLLPSEDGKLSNSYRYLGSVWKYNPRTVIPRRLNVRGIIYAKPGVWSMVDLAVADDDVVDELVYVITGWKPDLRTKDLGVTTKGQFVELIKVEATRIEKKRFLPVSMVWRMIWRT